jgi:hypothetical protein
MVTLRKFTMWLLHFIPLVHFYKPWEYKDYYGGYDRQVTYCKVCNKQKHRVVNLV